MVSIVHEARGYYDALMEDEWRGRGDREKSARWRLAKRLGVPESQCFRLQYKLQEMRDVSGRFYRALRNEYERLCETSEEAADAYRRERLGAEHAAHKGAGASGIRVDAASAPRLEEAKERLKG